MKEAEAYSPPGVGLPNVAHDRGHGITSIRVYCAADLVCAHWRVFTFDELAVPDELPVIHIPRAAVRLLEMREPKGTGSIGMASNTRTRARLKNNQRISKPEQRSGK